MFDLMAEVERFFEPSSLPAAGQLPQFTLIMGPPATGKTRHRRAHFAHGWVVLDAADIFVSLEQGEVIDFPAHLEGPLTVIGLAVARVALWERRHLVTEFIGMKLADFEPVMDAVAGLGYRIALVEVQAEPALSWQWNIGRSEDNISAYYTEPYHRRWLLQAAEEDQTLGARRPGKAVAV